jgi:hypothetical protein
MSKNIYRHSHSCDWFRTHPDFRGVSTDGVPRVLALSPCWGTVSQPCSCWNKSAAAKKEGTALFLLLGLMVLLGMMASPAFAEEGVLVPFPANAKGAILVWKNAAALSEGNALIRAQAAPQLLVPLIACVPAQGTRVIRTSDNPGMFLRGVMVLEGQWQGCRGVIAYERFKKTKD